MWKKEYQQKITTAREAVKCVRSGDSVYVGTASSFAYNLLDALWERRDELEDVTICCSMALKPVKMFTGPYEGHNPFRLSTYFLGVGERNAQKAGMPVEYTSFHLSQIDYWCREIAHADVCFFEVSEPDENGCCSFGPTGNCLHAFLQENARNIILEVNRQTPYIVGEKSLIPISSADAIIETDCAVAAIPEDTVDDISQQISDYILQEIPDGATIQLGIGKISTAVGYGLMQKNDLGIYSELFSEPMMHLMKNGNVTNRNKGFLDGVSVFGFAMGSKEMYDYMDHNQKIIGASFPFVNDPRNIAKNKNMISVNSAMAIDVFGQIAAEAMGFHQQSAVGGQIDFVKGSQWSEGGKSFIATSSSFVKNGERKSKIVLNFPPGTAISTPRSEVQYVVTEYGCVNLKPLTMSERINAMISLAHPDFREQLRKEAVEKQLIKS